MSFGEKKSIAEWHNEVFETLMNYKKEHPEFTFAIRQKNDSNNRFRNGWWFNGNAHYLFIAPFAMGDSHNKTKTIGLVLFFEGNKVIRVYKEVVFGDKKNQAMLPFYKKVLEILGIDYKEDDVKYHQDYIKNGLSVSELVTSFLNEYLDKLKAVIKEFGKEDDFIISEDKFKKLLNKKDKMEKLGPPAEEPEGESDDEEAGETLSQNNIDVEASLNTILYGPPGTGKTYITRLRAILISDPLFKEINNREAIMKRYDELVASEQIMFTTFHQSMSYEDFVEGIKPDEDGGQIVYRVEDGIFKKICNNASRTVKVDITNKDIRKKVIDFLEDNPDKTYKTILGKDFWLQYNEGRDSIGFRLPNEDEFKTGYTFNIETVVNYLQGVERPEAANYSYARGLALAIQDAGIIETKKKAVEPHVLIIDEINRANMSKVFGELITLIEDSKRIGESDAQSVVLPYSKKPFAVPSNLFIIGTMNTADRSIALMDTALRRRFTFEELLPDTELLDVNQCLYRFQHKWRKKDWDDENYKTAEVKFCELFGIVDYKSEDFENMFSTEVEDTLLPFDDVDFDKYTINENIGVNLKKMLKSINQRIEYLYDRDHTIGHAYFIGVNSKDELDHTMKNKIIPLLQEYFYDDWEKIQIVLGDHWKQFKEKNDKVQNDESEFEIGINKDRFIQSRKVNEIEVIGFDHEDIDDDQVDYKINNSFSIECYQKIYSSVIYVNYKREEQTENKA